MPQKPPVSEAVHAVKSHDWLSPVTALAVIIGLVSMGLTIVFGLPALAGNDRTLTVVSSTPTELTSGPSVEGLEGKYFYFGNEIDNLWVLDFIITNSGQLTIVHIPTRSDLAGENIELALSEGFVFVRADTTVVHPEASISISAENTSVAIITFRQWKVGERLGVRMFVTATAEEAGAPELVVDGRQIIDGELRLFNESDRSNALSERLSDRIPPTIAEVGRWIGIVVIGASGAIMFAAGIIMPITTIGGIG